MLSPVLTVSIFQKQSDPKVFSAGLVIFEEGQPGDEMYGILEGEVDILVNGKIVETMLQVLPGETVILKAVSAGCFMTAPKGVPHSYKNIGTTPARMLTLFVPAGIENFFEDLSKLTAH